MKKIRLVNYSKPVQGSILIRDRFYYVSLGNGYKQKFSNEKQALAFLAQTNKDLTKKMYELNFLYAEVLRMYRIAWVYFDTRKEPGLLNLHYSLADKITGIERTFNLIVERCHYENGNHFVFSQLFSITSSLKEICGALSSLYELKNHTIQMYEAQSYLSRLDHFNTAITIYPSEIELVKEKEQTKAVLKVV